MKTKPKTSTSVQEDNSPENKSKHRSSYQKKVNILLWPSQSPGLNPCCESVILFENYNEQPTSRRAEEPGANLPDRTDKITPEQYTNLESTPTDLKLLSQQKVVLP